jgi:hypothetical protein
LLTIFLINLVTSIGIVAVLVYICRIKLVRQKLTWILTVLSLLSVSFITETVLVALNYFVYEKTEISLLMYIVVGALGVVGGWTYSSSFAIFALEYYQASSLIALAKEGKPRAVFDKFQEQIKIIEAVVIVELLVSWLLLNVFYIQQQI